MYFSHFFLFFLKRSFINSFNCPCLLTSSVNYKAVLFLVIIVQVLGLNLGCYVRCATLLIRVGILPWPTICANNYYAQFGLPDKNRAIIELVVCWALLNQISIQSVWTEKERYIAFFNYP